MKVTTEVIRKVWDDDHHAYLTISPNPDDPGWIDLHSMGQEDYWGKFSVSMHPELARALGEALIASADGAKKSN